jgi:predicted DNA-binding transcriptional regulator AlpA
MARDADPWRDAQIIRKLRVENERLRQRLAGMQPQELRPAPRAHHKPMTLTWEEAAAFALRRSETWLYRNIDILPGFPRPHKLLGRFSTEEVERWVRDMFKQSS